MAEIKITESTFEAEVLKSDIPVLVDFWATWCGPCMMLAPTIAEIAEEMEGKVKVGKVNVDEEPNLSARFQIASIPTVMLFKDGKPVNAIVGFRPKDDILRMLG